MKHTELTKSLINSNAMTLAQARTTLDLTRHLVGELWEQKVDFLHSLLAKFYKQAFRSEKEDILAMVTRKDVFLSCIDNEGTLHGTINGVETFEDFMQSFLNQKHGFQKIVSIGALNDFVINNNKEQGSFKELAEEIFLLNNLDQAHTKLGDLAHSVEHLNKTFG